MRQGLSAIENNGVDHLIGNSRQMHLLRSEIDRVARSNAKVLITGESGVGKELVASALHRQSARAAAAMVPVNCAGIPETLLESELFGHTKGSFTGAYRDSAGKLEMADRSSLFLDEVGEMTLRMQGLLLRFLETGDIQKVGSRDVSRRVDVRLIAATNRDLTDLIRKGQFREDLFYRLDVIRMAVPPLRDHRDDIPVLIDHFISKFSRPNGNRARTISPDAYDVLCSYPWPGNVRELENVIERLVVRGCGDVVTAEDLPPEVTMHRHIAIRPKHERRKTVADELYKRLIDDRESFWTSVYPMYMQREITRATVRDLVRKGLEEARGNYKILARIFNMEPIDYKRFLNFLRKHDCQVPFKDYR